MPTGSPGHTPAATSERASTEQETSVAGRVGSILRRVELHLVLEAGERAIAIDDERGDARGACVDGEDGVVFWEEMDDTIREIARCVGCLSNTNYQRAGISSPGRRGWAGRTIRAGGGLMPSKKFRDVSEMEGNTW